MLTDADAHLLRQAVGTQDTEAMLVANGTRTGNSPSVGIAHLAIRVLEQHDEILRLRAEVERLGEDLSGMRLRVRHVCDNATYLADDLVTQAQANAGRVYNAVGPYRPGDAITCVCEGEGRCYACKTGARKDGEG